MALTHGLDFAILYACVLALFSYLAFWFVPIAARVVFVAVKTWLHPSARKRDAQLWFDAHHSQ